MATTSLVVFFYVKLNIPLMWNETFKDDTLAAFYTYINESFW